MNEFHLVLVAINPALCAAFSEYFDDLPRVDVVAGRFEELPEFDCMVSAANSFGLMDGGVDAAITQFFGIALMERVQKHIIEEHLGEQNVGTSFIVETGHPRHPFLAHTPTMRVPLDISRTDNVYRAMWAMLLAVRHHNRISDQRIHVVACPGMGTGTGRVPLSEAARQMAMAYRNFLNPPTGINWALADTRQRQVRYGGDFGFKIPPEGHHG
jgi:O-acetyl-ADP-ribose deacetylase (regulator of RNase III)